MRQKKIFEGIMAPNFPNLMKNRNLQFMGIPSEHDE